MHTTNSNGSRSRFSNRVVIVFLLMGTLILPAILLYPFNGDNDIWQWIATVFVRTGGLPYLAAWDHDFPGILLVHATAIYFLGNSMLAVRVVEYVLIFLTLVALYRTSRLWLSEKESLLGTVIFSLFYVYGRLDCMGQRDNFAVLPIVLAGFYFIKAARQNDSRSSFWLIGMGGVMVGLATCIRPTYAMLLVVPILTLYGIANFRASLVTLAGFCIPILLMTLPFALTPGGIHEAYLAVIRYNADLCMDFPPTSAEFSQYLHNLLALRTLLIFLLGGVWISWYAVHRARGNPRNVVPHREGSFLLLFFAALLFGMFIQTAPAACHFTPFYACFIPVLTKMLCDVTRSFGRWRPAILAALLIIIASVLYPWGLVRSYIQGGFSIESAYRYFPDSYRRAQENSYIASFLTDHTNPNDFVEIIGDPGVSWRTPRRKSTSFQGEWLFIQPTPSGQFTDYQVEWRAEFLQKLLKTSPRYIVIARDQGESISALFRASIDRTPEINNFLRQHYVLDTILETHLIYARQ